MSDKKIDFLAERDKRKARGASSSRGRSTDIPDYMKILYGEEASEHMDGEEEADYGDFDYEDDFSDLPAEDVVIPEKEYVSADDDEGGDEPQSVVVRDKRSSSGIYGKRREADFESDDDGFAKKSDKRGILRAKSKNSASEASKKLKKEERRKKSEAKIEAAVNEPMVLPHTDEKKRKKSAGLNVAAAIVAAVLIIVFIITAVIGSKRDAGYTLDYVTEGSIVNQGSGEVRFVRCGELLTAESSGTFVPNVNEGDKVPAGYVIGYVAEAGSIDDVVHLRNLDKVILSMQGTVGVMSSVDSTELDAAEENIDGYIRDLTDMAYKGRLTDCGDLLVQLTAMLDYRNELIISTESTNSSITELQREREALSRSLESRMKKVVAKTAGIVTFCISGDESKENELFSAFSTAGNYACDTSAIRTETKYTANTEVQSGQMIARVVTTQEYYVVVTSDEDYSGSLGKSITVTANNDNFRAKGSIISFSVNVNGGYNMIIKTNKGLRSSLEGAETVNFEISRATGYRVPLSALTDWDKPGKTARLAIVKAGTVRFVYVSVTDFDDEFAIIKNSYYSSTDVFYGEEEADGEIEPVFEANDCYVVNAADVTEGQVITK